MTAVQVLYITAKVQNSVV